MRGALRASRISDWSLDSFVGIVRAHRVPSERVRARTSTSETPPERNLDVLLAPPPSRRL